MKANRHDLLILKKWQVNTMKLKRMVAAFLAAATAFIPLSADSIPTLLSQTVYAEAHGMGAALPDWIPCDFDSALSFRNTYGATHVQDGLICIVFKENAVKFQEDEPQGMRRYEVVTTKDMMSELTHKSYGSADSNSCYEVVVYYAPQEKGGFEVALVDTWLKSSELDLGYNHAVAYYSFMIDDNMDITETDIYSWLPDCEAEFKEYSDNNGKVSAMDNYIVFCLESNAGTPYDWFEGIETPSIRYDNIDRYFIEDCSPETAQPLDGGTILKAVVYTAEIDGNYLIRWDYAYVNDYQSNQIERTLIADCTISDFAQKITLDDSYIHDAEFSYAHYSIYSNDLKASSYDIYNSFSQSESAVISSKEELVSFLSTYLNDKPLNQFVSQYSDSFFEDNVLLLNTYLDPYRGRVMSHGLDSVQNKDGKLIINYNSIIFANLMRTSYFDILKVVIPKKELEEKVVWNNKDTLNYDLKRISIIDEDTGDYIPITWESIPDLFGNSIKYFEGQNPFYWDTEFFTDDWHEISVDEKCLPEGYVLSETEPKTIKEYAYNTADIIFKVKNTIPVKGITKISATTPDLFSKNIVIGPEPAVATSKSELTEILSRYMSENYQNKYFSAYDDDFFNDNVLLLNFCIDSTGGEKIHIDDTDVSSDSISVYYTKPSTDFGICNTDYFCILHVTVSKTEYNSQKIEWKFTGDTNGDGEFGIADLVALQKWLIASSDTKISDLTVADLCKDNNIDVFDLLAMRKKLVEFILT